MLIPVWPVVGVDVFGHFTWRGKPHGPLPASGLTEAGVVCRETVVQRAFAHRPRALMLPVGPVHMVDRAQRFSGPLVQVLTVDLERVIAGDVDIR